ncbi:MAG: shikimate kinase [Thermoanaerobaculia bacterium]
MTRDRIYLIGFMASGKTTVGRLLADDLERPFRDLDAEIERRTGKSVPEIFADGGEQAFRRIEQEVLVEGGIDDRAVVATGGGTFCSEPTRTFMLQTGVTIWLHLPYSEVVRRVGPLGKRNRPLFRDQAQARELFEHRLAAYALADIRVDLSGREEPADVASHLAVRLREHMCGL